MYSIVTEVELFRDEAAASAYIEKQVAQVFESRGHRRQGVKIADADRFDADDVGDEATGVTLTLTSGDSAVFITVVDFRRGRIVGSADIVQLADPERVELDFSDDVREIAEALDERIQDVMADSERKRPVRSGGRDSRRTGPDPRRLALRAKDLSLSMRLNYRGYFRAPAVNGYLREYDSGSPVRLGGSEINYFRSLGNVFANARLAERDRRYLASQRGSRSVARDLIRGFFRRTDFTPGPIEAHPLRSPGQDTAAYQLSLAVPKGRLTIAVVNVRRGRLMASVGAGALEPKLDPDDVLALTGKLRERLRAAR